jgi:very-short-patch-repair endonuclease
MYRDSDQRDFARKLRNQVTEAEKRLWRLLRAQQLDGHKFRRQAAIGAYVVDFVCFAHKLIVELDGPQHCENEAAEHDARRTAWLTSRGFRVIRFWNHQLDEDAPLVVDAIRRELREMESSALQHPSPTLPARGRGPEGNEKESRKEEVARMSWGTRSRTERDDTPIPSP